MSSFWFGTGSKNGRKILPLQLLLSGEIDCSITGINNTLIPDQTCLCFLNLSKFSTFFNFSQGVNEMNAEIDFKKDVSDEGSTNAGNETPTKLVDEAMQLQLTGSQSNKPPGDNAGFSPLPVFNENNVLDAIKASSGNAKPILALSVKDGILSAESKSSLNDLKDKFNILLIDKSKATEKMRQGLPSNEFWALANLMGAKGDLNLIKDNYAGTFNGNDFSSKAPKDGLKAKSESFDPNSFLPSLSISGDGRSSKAEKPVSTDNNGRIGEQGKSEDVPRLELLGDARKNEKTEPGKIFAVKEALQAIEAAKANGKDILAINLPKEGLSEKDQAKVDALSKVFNVILMDRQQASQMMRKGMEKSEFWATANLMGAAGDTNNIKDNFAGVFSAKDFDRANAKDSLKPKSVSHDFSARLDELMNTAKVADQKPKGPSDKAPDKPQSDAPDNRVIKTPDIFDFHQGGREKKPDSDKLPKPDSESSPKPDSEQVPKPDSELPPKPDSELTPKPDSEPDTQTRSLKPPKPPEQVVKPADEPAGKPETGTKETGKPELKPRNDWLEAPDRPPAPDSAADATKDAVEKKPEKVKLEQMKFDEKDLAKAVALAKENNLPLVVYTGAKSCRYCPAASEKVDSIAGKMASEEQTRAVVVKLTAETAKALSSGNSENASLLREVLSHGTMVPRIGVYNPSDMSKPVGSRTIGNISEASLESHINSSMASALKKEAVSSKPDSGVSARPQSGHLYTEANLLEAASYAAKNDLPMLSLVGDKVNPNVRKAFEFLNEQKLAAAVEISRQQSKQMMSKGLAPKHFSALQSALNANRSADASVLNSYSADSLKKGNYNPDTAAKPKSSAEMMKFLKDSGVKFASAEQEKQLLSILDGRPADAPAENAGDGNVASDNPGITGDKAEKQEPANMRKARTAEEALAVIKEAKEKNLALAVHADTPICINDACTTEELSLSVAQSNIDKALFLELPMGGLKLDENADPELKAINDAFKAEADAKKSELDLHVYKLNSTSGKLEETNMPSVKPPASLFKTKNPFLRKFLLEH